MYLLRTPALRNNVLLPVALNQLASPVQCKDVLLLEPLMGKLPHGLELEVPFLSEEGEF